MGNVECFRLTGAIINVLHHADEYRHPCILKWDTDCSMLDLNLVFYGGAAR